MAITIAETDTIGNTFRRLREHDTNLNEANMGSTCAYSARVFLDDKPIHELITAGPIDIGCIEWDFQFKNGIRSLVRRGFYKIVGQPFVREIFNPETGDSIPTWSAVVLFSPYESFDRYFKFLANVGPMVNVNSIGFNMTTYGEQILISRALPGTKEEFSKHMRDKVFYVTQQVAMANGDKQTIWFKLQ